MKKTLIAVGLLSLFGTVQAASSVSLYGNVNVAITKKGNAGIKLAPQEYRYASHVGIKGEENLGGGYSAIFKLEAQIEPDKGTGYYGANQQQFGFSRHSYVGLVTPFGAFRFGRSTTPFVNMWVGGGYAEGRGIGEFTGGLAGTGLRTTHPEVSARWNNAVFYDIKAGGFTAGLAATTKGSESVVPTRIEALTASKDLTTITSTGQKGQVVIKKGSVISPATLPVDNEGKKGTKPAYGAYARYEGKSGLWGYKVGAAYQVDNGTSFSSVGAYSNNKNAPAESKKAWILASGLSYGPVKWDIGYAQSKIDNRDLPVTLLQAIPLKTAKSKSFFTSIGYDITPNDHVYASYGRYKRDNNFQFATPIGTVLGSGEILGSQYSIGYEHRLSKRTVVYANARKVTNIKNNCSTRTTTGTAITEASPLYVRTCGVSKEVIDSVLNTEKGYSWDLGLSHLF